MKPIIYWDCLVTYGDYLPEYETHRFIVQRSDVEVYCKTLENAKKECRREYFRRLGRKVLSFFKIHKDDVPF